jgi:hypothetical protein
MGTGTMYLKTKTKKLGAAGKRHEVRTSEETNSKKQEARDQQLKTGEYKVASKRQRLQAIGLGYPLICQRVGRYLGTDSVPDPGSGMG